MRVEGKVALISGGAGGIGAATAELLAKEGASVVIGDLLEQEGHSIEHSIKRSGGQALFINLDVTDGACWDRAVEAAVSNFGKLDILVNNAGISHRAGVEGDRGGGAGRDTRRGWSWRGDRIGAGRTIGCGA